MAKELKHIDIARRPELSKIVEEVRTANEPLVFSREGEDIAILRPVKHPTRKRLLKGRPTSADDPLWKIVGMAQSEGPGDVSENVDKYLAEAYLPKEG